MVISLGEKPISSKIQHQAKQHIEKWRQWQAPFQSKPQIVMQLEGGLTNNSFLVEAGSERAVLRLNNPDASRLGVDRHAEMTILEKLQLTHFVPRLYYSDSSILVTEYIDGYALDAENSLKHDIRKQIEQAIGVIQAIEIPSLSPTSYEQYLRQYCEQLSPLYLERTLKQSLLQIAHIIDAEDWHPVLCHHDLIPENIIQGANGLFIIDWEYASLGHPQFDYLRLLNSHHIMDIPTNGCSLQALQAIMVQLWYAIRFPELQQTVKQELLKIIQTVNI